MKIKEFKAGDRFVCIKNRREVYSKPEFSKGHIYDCLVDDELTNNFGSTTFMPFFSDPDLYFEKLVPSVVEELKTIDVEAILKKMDAHVPAKPQVDKTTQGPWYAVNYAGYINIQPSPNYSHINLLDMDRCENAEANGKLAAAAPDLLRIVKEFVKESTYISSSAVALYELRNQAEALVNKLKPHRCSMFNKSSKGTFCVYCGELKESNN